MEAQLRDAGPYRRRANPNPSPNPNPNPHQVEISWICDATDKMHMIVPAAVKEEAETAAKAYREAMDDD